MMRTFLFVIVLLKSAMTGADVDVKPNIEHVGDNQEWRDVFLDDRDLQSPADQRLKIQAAADTSDARESRQRRQVSMLSPRYFRSRNSLVGDLTGGLRDGLRDGLGGEMGATHYRQTHPIRTGLPYVSMVDYDALLEKYMALLKKQHAMTSNSDPFEADETELDSSKLHRLLLSSDKLRDMLTEDLMTRVEYDRDGLDDRSTAVDKFELSRFIQDSVRSFIDNIKSSENFDTVRQAPEKRSIVDRDEGDEGSGDSHSEGDDILDDDMSGEGEDTIMGDDIDKEADVRKSVKMQQQQQRQQQQQQMKSVPLKIKPPIDFSSLFPGDESKKKKVPKPMSDDTGDSETTTTTEAAEEMTSEAPETVDDADDDEIIPDILADDESPGQSGEETGEAPVMADAPLMADDIGDGDDEEEEEEEEEDDEEDDEETTEAEDEDEEEEETDAEEEEKETNAGLSKLLRRRPKGRLAGGRPYLGMALGGRGPRLRSAATRKDTAGEGIGGLRRRISMEKLADALRGKARLTRNVGISLVPRRNSYLQKAKASRGITHSFYPRERKIATAAGSRALSSLRFGKSDPEIPIGVFLPNDLNDAGRRKLELIKSGMNDDNDEENYVWAHRPLVLLERN